MYKLINIFVYYRAEERYQILEPEDLGLVLQLFWLHDF